MSTALTTVRKAYDTFARGDFDGVIAMVSPDVEWETVGRPDDYPLFGARRGVDGVRDFFTANAEHQEIRRFEPQAFHDAGDTVIVEGQFDITVKKTGKPFEIDFVHLFTIRDGKIVRFREFAAPDQTVLGR